MEVRWRKSSRSEGASNCVEMACEGPFVAVRDSKHPAAGNLRVRHVDLLAAVKAGRLDP